ncbi:MAG: phosphoglycerate dehydrogenase [Treponema sp.]|jgi:D-3-phosphoglycerate dehydrogenase|nr:phosphoglycerate dehydrogenase [Treponema sp.]
MKVLITPTSFYPQKGGAALELLRSFSTDLVFNPHGKSLTEDELIPLVKNCDGFIAGLDYITRKVLENAPKLKVISRYGVGVDRVDLVAAKEKNIVVCNTPGVNANAVADLTFALLLGIVRKVPLLDRKTREGHWLRSIGFELNEKTIGIIGFGAIGKAVAKRASGFSMKILAYDPVINHEYALANGIIPASFDEVTKEADFVSLHLPLVGESRNIISGEVMKNMKKGAIIINTSRGGLIDEYAAYELLVSGHLGGLGLDTFEVEPPGQSPLFSLDNVVVTPHTGARTTEATAAMAGISVKNLINVLSGKNCPNIVS